jgi:hypothetical protein
MQVQYALTNANAVANSLKSFPKHGVVRGSKFLVI